MSTAAEVPIGEDRAVAVPAAPAAAELPVTIIERRRGWQLIDLHELWRSRELLFFLAWRDVKVRYKQTVLGAAWALLQPLATMIVFSLFLGRAAGVGQSVPNYPLFVFAGILPWTFFANAVTSAGGSVVGNQNLITKVYFPRLLIPLSAVAAGLVDFLIGAALLAVMAAWYGVVPGAGLLLAPVIVLILGVAALGAGTLLAALTVAYRDFRYVVPFGVQLWLFATPTIYMGDLGPLGQTWLPLNPAQGLIYNLRHAVLGGPIEVYSLVVSSVVAAALLVVGCLYFRRVERSFADVI